ncbi:MAG: CheR family methyltransferase [Polyangiaceae bacterium]
MSWQAALVELVASRIGVQLAADRFAFGLERFLAARVSALGLSGPADYVAVLTSAALDEPEWRALVSVVTIGQTAFFRDRQQLSLVGEVMAELQPSRRAPLSLWSAGCATGEEAYTLAIIAARLGIPARVLGTDVDREALEVGRQGGFSAHSLRRFPHERRVGFLEERDGTFWVAPSLRRGVDFAVHNLLATPPPAPGRRGWDVILCRNVLIYFDLATSEQVVDQLSRALAPDGWLFLGHSDSLRLTTPRLRRVMLGGRVAYRPLSSPPTTAVRPPPRPPQRSLLEPLAVASRGPVASLDAITGLIRAGQLSAAAEALTRTLAADDSLVLRLTLGNVLLASDELERAAECYAAVRERAPLLAETHYLEGLLHRRAHQLVAAADAARRALFLEPELWPAAVLRGTVLDRLGDRAGAQAAFRQASAVLERGDGTGLQSFTEGLAGLDLPADEARALCRAMLARRG